MGDVPIRPSSRFDYAEYALECVCRGCRNERGWLDLVDERDPVCRNMLAIQDDVEGSLVMRDGRPACPRRPAPRRPPKAREARGQMSLFEDGGEVR